MKLHEIIRRYHPDDHNAPDNPAPVTVEIDGPLGGGQVEVDVKYTSSPGWAATYDEPGDLGEVEIQKITLGKETEEYDDDDEVIKTWPKGTDVEKIPSWTAKHDDKARDQLIDYLNRM